MALSNTATPIYYGRFREAVMRGEIPVCREIAMEMERIDDLIANPGIYYDDKAVNGFISFCEDELTLTDGTDVKLLDPENAICVSAATHKVIHYGTGQNKNMPDGERKPGDTCPWRK